MASFTGLKNVGEDVLEYMMKHRPWPDEELSAGLHDLDNVFPGIYGRHASDYKNFADDPRIDAQSLKVINAVRGNPEAMVDIYRAVPKGVRDFNTGDWVSISKNYAKRHGESALNGDYDLIKAKARAADISEHGDSIAEQGYWGSPVVGKINRGILPFFADGSAAALSPGEAQAAQASESPDGGFSWQDVMKNMARGFSLGTRNVLEGLGRGATQGSGNPGGVVSDWLGLARPETEAERLRGSIIEGISGAVPMSAGGMGVARMAAGPVARGVGRELSATPGQDALLGGLLGYFGWGD